MPQQGKPPTPKAETAPAPEPDPAPVRAFVPPRPRPLEESTSLGAATIDGRTYEVVTFSDTGTLLLVERDPARPGEAVWRLKLTLDSECVARGATILAIDRGLSVSVYGEHWKGGTIEESSWVVSRDGRLIT